MGRDSRTQKGKNWIKWFTDWLKKTVEVTKEEKLCIEQHGLDMWRWKIIIILQLTCCINKSCWLYGVKKQKIFSCFRAVLLSAFNVACGRSCTKSNQSIFVKSIFCIGLYQYQQNHIWVAELQLSNWAGYLHICVLSMVSSMDLLDQLDWCFFSNYIQPKHYITGAHLLNPTVFFVNILFIALQPNI